MMLYLTGAATSLKKSPTAPQNDTAKSLGGYVSSTTVPNGEINALFDLLSSYTLDKRKKETIAIALINQLPTAVTNVALKVVVGKENIASFKVAAVSLDNNMAMEHIANRYAEPMLAEFYNADFQRASVDLVVTNPAGAGEEIALFPFNVSFAVQEAGIEGTWKAMKNAFSNNSSYEIIRLSEKKFRVLSKDETLPQSPATCSYVATAGFTAQFLSKYKSDVTNSVVLVDEGSALFSGKGIGLWLQRDLKEYEYPSNSELIENYKNKAKLQDVETAELVITFDAVPTQNYNSEYNQEDYS